MIFVSIHWFCSFMIQSLRFMCLGCLSLEYYDIPEFSTHLWFMSSLFMQYLVLPWTIISWTKTLLYISISSEGKFCTPSLSYMSLLHYLPNFSFYLQWGFLEMWILISFSSISFETKENLDFDFVFCSLKFDVGLLPRL